MPVGMTSVSLAISVLISVVLCRENLLKKTGTLVQNSFHIFQFNVVNYTAQTNKLNEIENRLLVFNLKIISMSVQVS